MTSNQPWKKPPVPALMAIAFLTSCTPSMTAPPTPSQAVTSEPALINAAPEWAPQISGDPLHDLYDVDGIVDHDHNEQDCWCTQPLPTSPAASFSDAADIAAAAAAAAFVQHVNTVGNDHQEWSRLLEQWATPTLVRELGGCEGCPPPHPLLTNLGDVKLLELERTAAPIASVATVVTTKGQTLILNLVRGGEGQPWQVASVER